MNLTQEKCQPCESGGQPLSVGDAAKLLAQVPGWSLDPAGRKISNKFAFKDFKSALAFVDKVGGAAEAAGHHPEVRFGWGYVVVELWTHAVNGLSRNDFILAAQINEL